jgi:hypothetical protein
MVIVAVTILLLDLGAYLALPSRFAMHLPGYRVPFHDLLTGGQGKYPRDYFVAHPERGFDIGADRRGTHYVEGLTYPIWSNALGCFDKEWARLPADYYYFAGDSMTWGYAPYETKFATVFEARTGIPSLKCGVTHTGQLHQFAKFLEVTSRIGALPKKVFVGYFFNDTANDYGHPQATVVRGWLIDESYLDRDLNVVRVDDERVSRQVDLYLAARAGEPRVPKLLLEYSFTAQVVANAYASIVERLGPSPPPERPFERLAELGGPVLLDMTWLSQLQTRGGRLEYEAFRFAARNKDVIRRWKADSIARGYELVFLLFEPRDFYGELIRFLDENDVAHIDVADELHARGFRDEDIYWPHDGHFSPQGNGVVGEILSEIEGRAQRIVQSRNFESAIGPISMRPPCTAATLAPDSWSPSSRYTSRTSPPSRVGTTRSTCEGAWSTLPLM